MPRRPRRDAALFESLLFAPDRERIPGARPVVSFDEDDDPSLLNELEAVTHDTVELSRRGAWHGRWAELDLRASGLGERNPLGDLAGLRRRWRAARPVVLPEVACDELAAFGPELRETFELFERLGEGAVLGSWLRAREEDLPPGFVLLQRRARLADAERDLDKQYLGWSGAGRRDVRDLWAKSGWLSTHPDDGSLRLRFSFGREVDDDASHDDHRHHLVADLAGALLPESLLASGNPAVLGALEAACGEEVFLTQHIAYWNCPEGGAAFHHDAFEERPEGTQLGVCYLQLAGRTAWLALGIEELAARVREFAEALQRGQLGWLRAQLFPRESDLEGLMARVRDERALLRELALPGCGTLGALVNRGPEFTGFLADAGHALVLSEGDALLLPNQGLGCTAMHSVFCASEHPTYGLSMAVRAARARPARVAAPDLEELDARDASKPDREEIRRRRRESPRRRR